MRALLPARRAALALALGCAAAGCRDGAGVPQPAPGEHGRALLALAADAARRFELPLADPDAAAQRLAGLAQQAQRRLRAIASAPLEQRVDALNGLFFDELGFAREVRDRSLSFALLPAVLGSRRGSCLGLAGAYLALAEAGGLPCQGVLVPGHFFVRCGGAREVELLRRGEAMPRAWYVERYRVPADAGSYLRALSPAETAAVFRFQLANEHRLRGEHRRAVDEYRAVLAVLPGYAEAHANLGLTLQHLGQRAAAEQAYRRAAAANPGLSGLAGNREALRAAQPR